LTSLWVVGAERSGVSVLAHALAHEEALPLCQDATLARARIAAGESLIVCAPDKAEHCPHLSTLPEQLADRPDARAVVVWRQAVDFVNSWLRARPDQHFVDHCRLWARARKEALRLQNLFPGRIHSVEFRALVDFSSMEARRRALVPGFGLTSEALAKLQSASASRGLSLTSRRPVVDAARAAWSMGEVEAFARICGPAMRDLGENVDLAAAARRRVLDIGRMFYESAYQAGRIEVAPSRSAGAPWTISVLGGGGASPQLRLTAVAAGIRRRLRLKTRARGAAADGFRWEAVEASTRRPLFAAPCQEREEIDAVLPAHDGWIEFALVGPRLESSQGFNMDLVEARLSHE
jgi:hypothetical protein